MKTIIRFFCLLCLATGSVESESVLAQLPANAEPETTVQGAPVATNLPSGQTRATAVQVFTIERTNADAKNDSDDSSRDNAATNSLSLAVQLPLERKIELVPGGARADFGLLKAAFPADIGGEDPVHVQTADGRKLAFRPMFLALRDAVTGESRMLGQITNRIGLVVSTNWVVFTNAFSGINADLRYRYSGGLGEVNSLEQDVLLHESVALPGEWLPENARLEVWTEWFDSEPTGMETQALDLRANVGAEMPVPAIVSDDYISLGSARIGIGHAFSSRDETDKVPVAKLWGRLEQRDWLVETVDYLALKAKLDALPVRQAALPQGGRGYAEPGLLIRSLRAPASDLRKDRSMWLVSADPSPKNTVVLDFIIVSSVPVPAGVISWWPGGGNALDATANDNFGYWVGTETYAAAKVGQGFSLDGVDDGVIVEHAESLGFTAEQNLTMETWIKAYTNSTDYDVMSIMGKRHPYGIGFELYLIQGKLGFQIGTLSAGPINYEVSGDLRNGAFHHVAVTVERGATNGGKLYVDGVPATFNAADTPGDLSNYEPFRIGVHPQSGLNCFFKGIIDEPAIYERALSQAEIQGIYNAGVAGKYNPNCVTASTNIVGWWPGDGNTYDFARTNFAVPKNGAAHGAAVASHGFSFDGTNDYLEIANAPDLNPTNGVTLEAWVYQAGGQYQNAPILTKDNPGLVRQYLLSVSSVGKFRAHVWTTVTGLAYFDGFIDVQLGGWYHVAMTYNGTNLILYVNGVQDRSAAASGKILTGTDPLRIGGSYAGGWGNYKFNGLIDEPTVYDRALSASEISAIYAAGTAGKCKVDTDGDGLSDLQEAFLGTNPNVADSDADGLTDGDEVHVYRTNPSLRDTDGDGLIDQAFGLFITSPKPSVQIP